MKRILKAFLYSLQGVAAAWRDEPAFREEIIAAAVMIPAAFWVTPDTVLRVLMIGSILLVLMFELVNTAVEAVVDLACKEQHPLAKKAKDTASAAVLVALINVGVVWGAVLLF